MPDFGAFDERELAANFAVSPAVPVVSELPVAPPSFAVSPTKTGVVTERGNGPDPADPDFAVKPANDPNFGAYGGSASRYVAPQLQEANGRFSTPYYAAYTNDGDLAGAVMVAPGQAVRLVDAKTGDVIFEGEGPEAAQQAVGIANAVSEDRGRKAAWAIQADYGPDKGWVSQAAERYDPKKSGFFGSLADIALPVLGAMLMPVTGGMSAAFAAGLGAAGGSALSSIAQGRSLSATLIRAAGAGIGAGVIGPSVNTALGSLGAQAATQGVTQGVTQVGTNAAVQAGTQGVLQAGAQAATGGLGNLLTEVVVNGVRTLVPAAVASGFGAAGGALAGGAVSGGGGSNTLQGDAGADRLGPEVHEVVVTAAKNGMTPAQIAAITGVSLTTVGAILNSIGGNAAGVPQTSVPPEVDTSAIPNGDVPLTTNVPAPPVPPSALASLQNWIAANPLQAAALGLTAAGAVGDLLGGGGGGGSGNGTINSRAGTPASLTPNFSAKLPTSNLAVRQPRDMSGTNWAQYGQGPEQSFFTSVPRRFATGGFAVRGPGDGRDDAISAELSDGEYVVDAETVALLGNGSNRAGADALDRFRVSVRKHKGRQLAAGRFSAKAKTPEAYVGKM